MKNNWNNSRVQGNKVIFGHFYYIQDSRKCNSSHKSNDFNDVYNFNKKSPTANWSFKCSTLERWSQLHGSHFWAYVDQFSHSLAMLCMCRYVLKLAAPLQHRWNLSVALSWPALTHKRRPDITNRQTRQSHTICTHCKYTYKYTKRDRERERFSWGYKSTEKKKQTEMKWRDKLRKREEEF